MTRLHIHVGPFKTGTTAVQQHFWAHRDGYLRQGLLYPRAGIYKDQWGPRHVRLAMTFEPRRWDNLVGEIDASGCDRVLLSAERFSQRMDVLAAAADRIRRFEPRMILVVRNEADLVRSMYLQVVKGRYLDMVTTETDPLWSFDAWWRLNRWRYGYARMLDGWAKAFGPDSIDVVPYSTRPGADPVARIAEILGVDPLPALPRANTNPSIGGFAARASVAAARLGPRAANLALRASFKLERKVKPLSRISVRGFDAEAVLAHYRALNREAMDRYPAFGRVYAQVHGDERPEPAAALPGSSLAA